MTLKQAMTSFRSWSNSQIPGEPEVHHWRSELTPLPQQTRSTRSCTHGPSTGVVSRLGLDNDLTPDILDYEPESDHDSDSNEVCYQKRWDQHRHWAQVQKLQYQAKFAKVEPPFVYGGGIQASSFKRWCREVRAWTQRSYFSDRVGIELSGKF